MRVCRLYLAVNVLLGPCRYFHIITYIPIALGAPVALRVKRSPADLAVPGSIPTRGGNLFNGTRFPLHTAYYDQPPIVLMLLKYC